MSSVRVIKYQHVVGHGLSFVIRSWPTIDVTTTADVRMARLGA